uniref:Cytochrome c biogenesis protein CcsA n=1 Tax=Chromochloris zofingiensis TaxID=31302 RepID=A0A140HA63_9CHLO|nr:heme attachment to plastid cytochrome c [Chromochloris zofingiensis]AMO01062.1 heme attachment to plastid cytochrome c [Chromochloris zofingiensis]
MTYIQLESFFSNFSFLMLFISLIYYWVQTGLLFKQQQNVISMWLANISLFCLLVLRWVESGHFPLSNLYESLIFLSWSFTVLHIILENLTNQKILGCITSPIALFTNAFASFSLPSEMQQSSPLVPALQSNWLMMHVTVMILSYAALICGSLLSIAYLILTRNIDIEQFSSDNSPTYLNEFQKTNVVFQSEQTINSVVNIVPNINPTKLKLIQNLDNLSYRILGIGFPFLTIGILSGAVWANEAWGSYWSWDPKETWALLTWLVFAIYLHTRLTKGWQGKKPAIIASLGFITVWICFLGVNLLGEGLHSYGWIQS